LKIKINNRSFFVDKTNIVSSINHWRYINEGTWEPHTFKILEEYLNTDCSYIDMGSWIGSTVLYGSLLAKHTYAIEPDPIALISLRNNIEVNEDLKKKITLFDGAISDNTGSFSLYNSVGESTSTLVGSGISINIKALSFDDFVKEYGIKDCNFIKMDIEGAEKIVLPSMVNYLEKCVYKPVLYISFHPNFFKGEDKENIKKSLRFYNNFCEASTRKKLTINNILSVREIIAWT
jgi:FkbM family methyltransferase